LFGRRLDRRVLAAGASLPYGDSPLTSLYTLKSEHSAGPQQGWNLTSMAALLLLIPPPA
jgi:hypothetical protein